MDNNRLLLLILGFLAVLLIVATAVVSVNGRDPPVTLTGSLAAVLGALVALANAQKGGGQ